MAQARLLPELAPLQNESVTLPALSAPGVQSRFFESVGRVLSALLAGPVPAVLWFDDAHWLDSASLELLLFLARRWRRRPYLLLLTWRTEDLLANHPLYQISIDMRRDGVGDFFQLTRFTLEEVAMVIAATDNVFPDDLPGRLFAETEGLPYFVVEYLAAFVQHQLPTTGTEMWGMPRTVRDLLAARLAQIGDAERQLLQTAAAIGHAFTFDLVQTASGRSEEEAVTSLENLVARGILVEETAAYDFSHEKLRELAYEETSLARRRLLHRRLAEALTHRRTPATTAVSAQIATHYQLAGHEAEAATYFVQAGDQARTLFAHQDAIHYYRSALALGAAESWRLHAACGELSMRLGAYPDALASYETAAALAPTAEMGHLDHQRAQVYQRQGSWTLAARTLEQAQQHLGDTTDPATLAHLIIDRSLVAHRQKQPDEALALAQQARVLAETADDEPVLALTFNILGILARSRGELEAAISFLEKSRQLADDIQRLDILITALNNLALTHSAGGQVSSAKANLEQALALCQRLGDRHYEAAMRNNLADVLHQAGEEAAAQEQIRKSVTIYAEIGREEDEWRAEIWQLMEW